MADSSVEYAVPRNPAIASPSIGEVIAGHPIGKSGWRPPFPDRVELYEGGRVPPGKRALIGRGRLLALERGFFFAASSGHPEWRETLREVEELAERGTAGAGLELAMDAAGPASGLVGRALSAVAVGCFMGDTGQDAVKARVDALERRLASTRSLALPYVDIVAVRCARAWSWSRMRSVRCCVLALESATGDTRTVCLTGPDDRLADVWLDRRFDLEFVQLAGGVWAELLSAGELWSSFKGRYPEPSAVPVGRIWDEWQGTVRARVASLGITTLRVAALALKRLGPWLDHYRRIPSVAGRVRAVETLAAGD